MKTIRFFLALIIGIAVGVTAGSSYATDGNVTVTANVTVGTIALTNPVALDFGSIVSGTVLTVIKIDSSAGIAATPAVVSPTVGKASVTGGSSGKITVTSNISANVNITYALTGSNGGAGKIEEGAKNMAIANIDTNSTAASIPVLATVPKDIHIGGELTVGINQLTGIYTGICVVSVIY